MKGMPGLQSSAKIPICTERKTPFSTKLARNAVTMMFLLSLPQLSICSVKCCSRLPRLASTSCNTYNMQLHMKMLPEPGPASCPPYCQNAMFTKAMNLGSCEHEWHWLTSFAQLLVCPDEVWKCSFPVTHGVQDHGEMGATVYRLECRTPAAHCQQRCYQETLFQAQVLN